MRNLFNIWFLCTAVILVSCNQENIIDGYTDKFSYKSAENITLFLNAPEVINDFKIKLTDLNGKVRHCYSINLSPQKIMNDSAYRKGYGYLPTAELKLPDLESGIYLFDNKIPFLIKPKKSDNPEILILYNVNTQNAYCKNGGASFYSLDSLTNQHSPILSFHRPIDSHGYTENGLLPNYSEPFFYWIKTQTQYNIGYISDKEMEDYGNIKKSKLLIIPGHSEYWTRKARRNFDRFVHNGNNALILSGNTMWWQVRYSKDMNQIICYKSKNDNVPDSLKTINWTDPILNYSVMNSIGIDFNHGGYGNRKDNGWDGYKIVNKKHPIFKGVDMENSNILHLLSAEYDGAILNISKDSSMATLVNENRFFHAELIGYDFGSRVPKSNGAWVIIKPTINSGTIINTGSTNWCANEGMKGVDSDKIKLITLNMINLLLKKNDTLFVPKPKGT